MGSLAREVRRIVKSSRTPERYICVLSGTAEMRAAWFLLASVGVLPATLLQVGSPADPLFGAALWAEQRYVHVCAFAGDGGNESGGFRTRISRPWQRHFHG